MKNQWLTFFSGRILVKVDGKGIERLINKLTQSNLLMWKVRRIKNGSVVFFIALSDLHKIRHISRGSECTISFVRGEGFPFLWKRTMKNSGFLVGVFLFFIIAAILSNITWGIHIKGADPETEHKIRLELNKLGIKVGSPHLLSGKPGEIQRKLTDSIDNITWVGVDLKGTTYHFQVVQKTEPEQGDLLSPRHLVAKKKAVIAEMFVENGKPLVKVHQYVEEGQILVSGTIGNETQPLNIPAKGEIWGFTWYDSEVEIALESNFQVYTGEEKRIHSIKIGKTNLPFWGFGKVKYTHLETEIDDRNLYFFGWKLPIMYSEKTIREKEEKHRIFTAREALEEAKDLARRELQIKIPADARVDKEYILHEEVENGKVKLLINFQVIENIAEEKPIIQGE